MTNHVRKAIMILSAVCALFILFGSSFVAGGAENPTDQPTNLKSLAIESILIGSYGRELCGIIQAEMLSLGPDDVLVETYGLEGGQSRKKTASDPELWNAIQSLEAGGLTQKYLIEDGELVSFTILAEPDRYRVVIIHEATRIDNLPQVIKRHSRE
jgi:hypothetical protein